MGRFQCIGCDREHGTATGCPRCGSSCRQVEICRRHGARPVRSCGCCRVLIRAQTGL